MISKESIQKQVRQVADKYNLKIMIVYKEEKSISYSKCQFAKRNMKRWKKGATVTLYNDKKQKASLSLKGQDEQELVRLLEETVNLLHHSPKKFEPNEVENKVIEVKEYPLEDFDTAKELTLSKIEELIGKHQDKIDAMNLIEYKYGRITSSISIIDNEGNEVRYEKPEYDQFSVELLVKKDEKRDEVYLGDVMYGWTKEIEDQTERAIKQGVDKVLGHQDEMTECKGNILIKEYAAYSLLGNVVDQLYPSVFKEGRGLLIDKEGKSKDLSPLLSIIHTTETDTPYDDPINGYGEIRQNCDIVKDGKVINVFSSLSTEQKYGIPSNGISSPSTLIVKSGEDISEHEYDIIVTDLLGAHNIDDLTLDANVTASGYLKKDNKWVFTNNLHLNVNLIELFTNKLKKVGQNEERLGSIIIPELLCEI